MGEDLLDPLDVYREEGEITTGDLLQNQVIGDWGIGVGGEEGE